MFKLYVLKKSVFKQFAMRHNWSAAIPVPVKYSVAIIPLLQWDKFKRHQI